MRKTIEESIEIESRQLTRTIQGMGYGNDNGSKILRVVVTMAKEETEFDYKKRLRIMIRRATSFEDKADAMQELLEAHYPEGI